MQEFESIINQESDWALTLFLALFSAAVAIFYTFIFLAFYTKTLKPKWLFFVLLPSIIVSVKLIFNKYVTVTFILIFVSTFLLFLVGAIFKGTKGFIKTIKKRSKKEKGINIFLSIAKNLVIIGIIIAGFIYFGPTTVIFIIVFGGIFKHFIFPNKRSNFLNLQANLPTSKIQSMAMGLVEVVGKTSMQEPLLSRIGKKPCIGYRYKIEKINKSKDGKTQYSTISDIVVCNDFILTDKTDQVQVIANDIHFLWIEEDDSYSSGSKRYTQYLLLDNQNILLVGKANSKANTTFIEKEPIKNIFTLAPYNAITKWNRNKPLLNSFLTYLALLFLIIALILITEINVIDDVIHFKFNLSWDTFSITNIFK